MERPATGLLAQLLRAGSTDPRDVRRDVLWLCGLALLLIATGIGLRDPWPADEPRFALIARDMVATHQWLIPEVGGDIYSDKPPLFFWLIGAFLLLTDSLRVAFLLPSALAGIGCVVLVYDIARRLWNRETGLIAGLALLGAIQFVWQARQAQIDATLCFFTTLSLYGLLRHLLLGPAWRWYVLGWAAAGLGIITKGVGFLPLLVFIPYFAWRGANWSPRPAIRWDWRWLLGPLALLAAAGLWGVPMLLAASDDPVLAQYRHEILFKQTVDRYADPWHHHEPFWYFLVNVIPVLWLPLTALLPWLWSHWRENFRQRDLRVLLPLTWVGLVVLFFSISSGKRGVYVLPALPAFALACAPWLKELAERRGVQRTLFGVACAIAGISLAGGIYFMAHASARLEIVDMYDVDPVMPLLVMGSIAAAVCLFARPARGVLAYGLVLTITLCLIGSWIGPLINEARSSSGFIRKVETAAAGVKELGFVAYKEQYLLYVTRPVWNFGHARWRELQQEAADAAAWLAADPARVLLVDDRVRKLCFGGASVRAVDTANRMQWFLATGAADPACVAKGKATAAILYTPPAVK